MSTDSNSDERPPSTTKDAEKEAEELSDKGSEKESGSGELYFRIFIVIEEVSFLSVKMFVYKVEWMELAKFLVVNWQN